MRIVLDIFRANLPQPFGRTNCASFLTMFGIALGSGIFIAAGWSWGRLRSGNKRELAEFGRDIMFIFPGRAPVVSGSMNSARSYLLTYEDYQDIRQAAHVRNASPVIARSDLHEVSEFATASGEILGTEPQLNEISYLPLKEGRWLNELDGAQRRNVIVLGNELFEDPISGPSVSWCICAAEWNQI